MEDNCRRTALAEGDQVDLALVAQDDRQVRQDVPGVRQDVRPVQGDRLVVSDTDSPAAAVRIGAAEGSSAEEDSSNHLVGRIEDIGSVVEYI